ncbi:MAG TPA: hypothetical protein VMF06_12730 [Candidatus Limnocylindria bacterium]|jgi:hypothetical protein|nr:hypothetical protein [Candidatus Limnocylindria bacterium]
MKRILAALGSLLAAAVGHAQNSGSVGVPAEITTPPTTEIALRQPIGPHSTTVQVTTLATDALGKVVTNIVSSYTEMAAGLNYWESTNRVWAASVPEWELVQGAALAWKCQTKVSLGATLDSDAPVQIRLPSGELMFSRVQGVALYNAENGQSALASTLRDGVQGVQIAPDQIIYPDCLEGAISGDLRYTIRIDGLEQDLIIRQADLSANTLATLGFESADPSVLTVETWSEFSGAPQPRINPVLHQGAIGGRPVTLADQELEFGGSMKMAAGRSFLVGQESQTLGFVAKQWLTTPDARQFLVESIPLSLVEEKLPATPPSKPGAMKTSSQGTRNRMEALNALPRHRKENREASILPLKSAAKGLLAWLGQPGLILDYATLNTGGFTNYLFAGDSTTFLPAGASITLYGTNSTWEAGSVVKYGSNATMTVKSPVTWQGSAYRPVVLCGVDDRSVGENVGSGTSPGTNLYAATALILDASTNGTANTSFNIAHVRIANAQTAVQIIQGTNPHTIKHAQFINCGMGISATSTTLSLLNGLLVNVRTNFGGSSVVGDLEHVTVDGGATFQNGTVFSSLGVTNSIIAGVTTVNLGSNTNQVATLASASGLFPSLSLGASHYLVDPSPYRNMGTTGINPMLASEISEMTTFAPVELGAAYSVGQNLTLVPQVQRDLDVPDLGYHEYALDYVAKGITVTGTSTLSLLNGVAIGFYGTTGFTFTNTSKLVCQGLPEGLNRLTSVNTVFEQPQAWVTNSSGMVLISGPGQSFRFTDFAFLGNTGRLCGDVPSGTLTIQDSQLRGVRWTSYLYSGSGSTGATITLRNNFLERCSVDWTQGYAGTPYYLTMTWQNNLFSRCSIALAHCSYYYGAWSAWDNVFDNSSPVNFSEFGGGLNVPWTDFGFNGYINTSRFLVGAGDKTGLLRDFISGPLGDYYYPTNSTANSLSTLINADTNRTPGTTGIGLYHYTTTLDQAKEGTSALDIGWHQIALENHRASVEFTGTQGSNNWWYAKSTAPLAAAYTLLPNYGTPVVPRTNTWYDAAFSPPVADAYTWIWADSQHPGSSYDTARLWQASLTAKLSIWSTATDSSPCLGCGSDGIRVQMARNGISLTPWVTLPNYASSAMNARTFVQPGDILRFQVNKNANNTTDGTGWDPLVVVHRGVDSNFNGIPDWLEDADGSGTRTGNETTWNSTTDPGLDVWITRPTDKEILP